MAKVVLSVACPLCKQQQTIKVNKSFRGLAQGAWKLKHRRVCPKQQPTLPRRD